MKMRITYELKRRVLMTISGVTLFLVIIMCYSFYTILDPSLEEWKEKMTAEELRIVKAVYIFILAANFIVGTITQFIGFIGAWLENRCLSVLYSIGMVFMGLAESAASTHYPFVWFLVGYWLFCFVLQLTFTIDLFRKNRQATKRKKESQCSTLDVRDKRLEKGQVGLYYCSEDFKMSRI